MFHPAGVAHDSCIAPSFPTVNAIITFGICWLAATELPRGNMFAGLTCTGSFHVAPATRSNHETYIAPLFPMDNTVEISLVCWTIANSAPTGKSFQGPRVLGIGYA